jgi:hypothetical protein
VVVWFRFLQIPRTGSLRLNFSTTWNWCLLKKSQARSTLDFKPHFICTPIWRVLNSPIGSHCHASWSTYILD